MKRLLEEVVCHMRLKPQEWGMQDRERQIDVTSMPDGERTQEAHATTTRPSPSVLNQPDAVFLSDELEVGLDHVT